MIWKIGRYYYKTMKEKDWGDIHDLGYKEEKEKLFALIDYDGEPIQYLRRIKKPKVFKHQNINKEVKNGKKS